jgi:succinoglycan biosynthesis transport protein ExoP
VFHQTQLIKSATIELPDAIRAAASTQLAQFNLGTYWSMVCRQKWLILAMTLLSLAAAGLFVAVTPPKYMAVTQILIDPTDLRVVDNGLTPSTQVSEVAVLQAESQVRVLTSDNVLRRVIASEKLDSDQKFVRPQESLLGKAITSLLSPFGLAHAITRTDPTLAALYQLRTYIRVKRAERTYVVDVTVTTDDAEKSVRIANALARAYLAEQAAARSEAARRVSESLSARLSELKERVRVAEERVEDFKARNNIVGVSGQLMNEQQLSDLNYQLSLARSHTAEAKSRYEQVQALQKSKVDVGAFTEAVQSQTIGVLRGQYAEVVRREAELMTSLGPRHPSVVEAQAQVQRLRRLIAEEVNRVAEAAAADYERARANEESLARSLDTLKRNTIATNEARVALRELERDVQASRTVYEAFLVRARETGEQERLDARNVRVISQAEMPQRRSWPPSYLVIAFGAMAFGASAGTGLALLRGMRAAGEQPAEPTSVVTPIAAPVGPPIATPVANPVVVPALDTGSKRPLLATVSGVDPRNPFRAFDDPKSQPATEIRKLSDALRDGRARWAGQSILLVAPPNGGDTPSVAANLALVAAASHSVLLVDTDLRRRALAAVVTDYNGPGLMEVASKQKLLSEVVFRDPRTNISVLPLCANEAGGFGRIEDDDLRAAFDLTKRFDLVVVAATIEDDNPAADFFADLVDQIVLITKKDATRKHDIDGIAAALGDNARKIRGTVMTGADS